GGRRRSGVTQDFSKRQAASRRLRRLRGKLRRFAGDEPQFAPIVENQGVDPFCLQLVIDPYGVPEFYCAGGIARQDGVLRIDVVVSSQFVRRATTCRRSFSVRP